jgi:hypothetical protein
MKSRLIAIAIAVSIAASLLLFTIVLADPADPFSASAEATAIDANLLVDILPSPGSEADVGVLIGYENADITGTVSAIETGGNGLGVRVTENSPLIAAAVEVVTSSSYTDTTSPGTDSETDSLLTLDTLLVDTAAISSTSTSESLATRFTTGQGYGNDLEVFGDPLGLSAILNAATISETAHTESTAAGDSVMSSAEVRIEDFSSSLFPVLGQTVIVTADVITSNASVVCDDDAEETASAGYNFVNLEVQGVPVVVTTPGTQVTITIATVDVAVLTIGPVLEENTTNTSANASAVALRLELIADVGALDSGTVINLASSTASCNVTEPLAVKNQGLSAQHNGLPTAAVGLVFALIAVGTIAVGWRRRKL